MNTDTIVADIQYLEDQYASKMVLLESTNDADERRELIAELNDMHRQLSQKVVVYERLEASKLATDKLCVDDADNRRKADLEKVKLDLEKERVELDRLKLEIERDRIAADREIQASKEKTEHYKATIEGVVHGLTKTLSIVVSAASLAGIMYTELKGNGFLDQKLLKRADDIGRI